jgi:hypothetical protein
MIKSVECFGTIFLLVLYILLTENYKVFFRLFLIVSVRFETVLFVSVVSIKVRNTETNRKIFFWFHETNRNKRETDLVSVCFGSNRKILFFVSRTPYPALKVTDDFHERKNDFSPKQRLEKVLRSC